MITKDVNVSGPTKMMAISGDIVAVSDSLEGGRAVLAYSDSIIPIRNAINILYMYIQIGLYI